MSDESSTDLEGIWNSPIVMAIGAILGILLVLGALGFVFWGEHWTINKARSLEQGASAAQTVSADRADPANNGKPVHLVGEATPTQDLADPDFGIAGKFLRLAREGELYQWTKKESKKDKKTTITFDKTWSKEKPKKIDEEHVNPADKPYADAKFSNADVKIGAFTLIPSQVEQMPINEELPITQDMLAKLPEDLKGRAKVDPEGRLFVSAPEHPESTPGAPQVDDMRFHYKVAKPQTYTLAAQQKAPATFEPYVPPKGEEVNLVKPGALSKEKIFEAAQASTQVMVWLLRVLGFVVLALGLFLVIRRQVVASGVIPSGLFFEIGLGILAALISIPLVLMVIGGRWVVLQPAIGASLLAGGAVLLPAVVFGARRLKPGLFGGGKKWTPKERESLRSIALDPGNRERRLAFASELEKKGDPLGEFIRIDQELEDLPADNEGRQELDSRWAELLQTHGRVWYAGLRKLRLEPRLVGNFWPAMWMHHGIIDQVLIDLDGILPQKAAQLFEAVPGLRVLEFNNVRMEQGLGGWKDIEYHPNVPAIVKVPQLKQIRVLRMSSLSLTLEDLEAITSSPNLENLIELDFSYNKVGPEGAELVAQSTTLKRLQVLALRACEIGEEGAITLAGSANLARLINLNLGANAIGPKGVIALANSAHLKNLQELALDDNNLGMAGAQAVAASPHFRQLTVLDLGRNDIGTEGALPLAKSPNLAKLTTLKLNDNKLGGMGLRYLASSPHPVLLKILELDSNEIDDSGAKTLGVCPVIKLLEELSLSYNNITDIGIIALANWAGLARLKKLSLRQNKIGAAGVKALASSPHLRGLKELTLGGNNIGLAGARALASSDVLKDLEHLWIEEANLTSEGEELLREKFGDAAHIT